MTVCLSRTGKNNDGQVDPLDTFLEERLNHFVISSPVLHVGVIPGKCDVVTEVRNIIDECNVAYTIFNEEKGDFGLGWKPLDANQSNKHDAYMYRTAEDMDGYPYWGVCYTECYSQAIVMHWVQTQFSIFFMPNNMYANIPCK